MLDTKYVDKIAHGASVRPSQVSAALRLFEEGGSIPFVARYRKDVTGNLDEVKLEIIAEQSRYFEELEKRRRFVLETIAQQGKLTDELRERILACDGKTALEDLYLPFKKARHTKAAAAREKGLEPLADFIFAQEAKGMPVEVYAEQFLSPEKSVSSIEEAIEGALHIIAERISVDAGARAMVREFMVNEGKIAARATKNAEGKKSKYEAYYDFSEPVSSIPSHRFLAIQRGVREGLLRTALDIDDAAVLRQIENKFIKAAGSVFEPFLKTAISDAYNRLLRPSLENDVLNEVRELASDEAIKVFRENAENLLLAPPAGALPVIGLDPGQRTGCKLAAVDAAGTFLESATIYPGPPQNDVEGAARRLLELIEKHKTQAIAIGNGTGAREAMAFVKQTLAKAQKKDVLAVLVNEAGASIYSSSKLAREEYPDVDVTIRGAISIAHRLQDPLAELVKIEPRHIGVGQYQHDINQKRLREGLHRTVVNCVNQVGVDLNTASVSLLRYVSGIQLAVAKNLVLKRQELGRFTTRQQLLSVDGIGPKTFEQCAGFLRIREGVSPLDATGIHPEAYEIVQKIAEYFGQTVEGLIGNRPLLAKADLSAFANETVGALTLEDIRHELLKPGRDPRRQFRAPQFIEGVDSVEALEEGMESEGVVTNVTDFGAFVDIGVHHDGLVHLSELAHRYIHDPRTFIKVGDIVKVRVIKVDRELPRISLSMKALQPQHSAVRKAKRRPRHRAGEEQAPAVTAPAPVQPHSERRPIPAEGAPGDGRASGRRRKPERSKRPIPHQGQERASGRQSGAAKSEPLNTMLADQLAALREKLGS